MPVRAVTGAMAEDAIGDSMDGLGGRSPERRLEILKDSRIGAYGVIGITLFIGLKASALAHLLDIRAAAVVPLFLAAEVVSRSASLYLIHALPAARKDGASATAGALQRVSLPCRPRLRGGYRHSFGRTLHQSGRGRVRLSFGLFHLPVMAALWRRLVGGQTGDLIGGLQAVLEIVALTAFILFAGGPR